MNASLLQFLNQNRQGMGMRPDNNPAGNPGMRPSMQPGMGGQVLSYSFTEIWNHIYIYILFLISPLYQPSFSLAFWMLRWWPSVAEKWWIFKQRYKQIIFICVCIHRVELHMSYLTPNENLCSVTEVYDFM